MNDVIERPTEVMTRMSDMKMAITMSPTIATFSAAFVKAQAEMGAAVKGKANPFFKSKYADLAEVIEVCKGPLNNNGIAFLQPVVNVATPTQEWKLPQEIITCLAQMYNDIPKDDRVDVLSGLFGSRPRPRISVCTMLLHESGEWMACVAEFPTAKEDPQAYFATTTYLRRASLQAILGIPAEDDDGNTAAGRKPPKEDHYSKAMTQAFPPGEELSGLLVAVDPPSGTNPPMAKIQTPDGVMGHEIFGDEAPYKKLIGCEVLYRYGKNGKFRPIEEMSLKPIKATVEVVEGPREQANKDDEVVDHRSAFDDEKTAAFAAQFERGTVELIEAKTSRNGEYHRLKIGMDDGPIWASVWHSPGHFGMSDFAELEAQEICFIRSSSEKNGKTFHNIEELTTADVFDEYITSRMQEVQE